MRYIIFGGSGFVGRYAVAALQEAMANSRIEKGEIVCVDVAEFVGLENVNFCENSGQGVNFAKQKSPSLANKNSNDKSPSLASGDSLSKSPSLAEGDLGGGLLKNSQNDSNSLNSKENLQISQDKGVGNSQNAEFTHPQTPSAREGASRAVPQARDGALSPIKFIHCDISQDFNFAFDKDDIVVHLAARAYAPKPPLKPFGVHRLKEYFFAVNVEGTKRIVAQMLRDGCKRLIYFSTDMVYGKPQALPVPTSHERKPFGYYGLSKKASEDFIIAQRKIVAGGGGFNATIFRPRMILGAGRYGILLKLFALMERNLPLPLIGNGKNCYQMVSVRDCTEAIVCAIERGVPNDEFNLGSQNPPCIKDLLKSVCEKSGSKSFCLPTYARGVKWILGVLQMLGLPLMYREQFAIADEQYLIDTSKTSEVLGWQPKDSDSDMLLQAYKAYRKMRGFEV